MNRRKMAGLAAALMLMTFAPIHTHAALRRVPEGMKTEQGEWTTKSKKDKEKDEESWQQEMLDSVNAARKKAGVAPLELDKKVGKAAQLRANECKQSYDHTRPNGKKSKTALDDAGVSYSWWGENINEKQKTVQSTMQSWMESKGHKANILNEKYTKVGFGRAKDESGSYYWVQMFAKTK
ncbi:MAG: CAP domain-containing protein [Negativibacillus sp.]